VLTLVFGVAPRKVSNDQQEAEIASMRFLSSSRMVAKRGSRYDVEARWGLTVLPCHLAIEVRRQSAGRSGGHL
jgi:hypothetical protein